MSIFIFASLPPTRSSCAISKRPPAPVRDPPRCARSGPAGLQGAFAKLTFGPVRAAAHLLWAPNVSTCRARIGANLALLRR
jgi:hypothetical protein